VFAVVIALASGQLALTAIVAASAADAATSIAAIAVAKCVCPGSRYCVIV
jgi:hypothetical protein